jgi:aminoglycoside phosphotransferase (APT) family kinase protein
VFAWRDGQSIKLFHAGRPLEAIDPERIAAEALAASAVPAPRYRGAANVGDRVGLIFDRVDGPSMLAVLAQQPWRVLTLARELADVHLAIHAQPAPDLQQQHAYLERMLGRASVLSERVRSAARERLAGLPQGDRLCHGDFHPDNLVLTPAGPMVLDWMTATQGEPAADVARTLMLLEQAALPPDAGRVFSVIMQTLRRAFASAYWRRYAAASGLRSADVEAWRLVVFAARLGEGPPEGEHIRKLLERDSG